MKKTILVTLALAFTLALMVQLSLHVPDNSPGNSSGRQMSPPSPETPVPQGTTIIAGYDTGHVMVRFKSGNNGIPVTDDDRIRAHASTGGRVEKDFGTDGIDGLQLVRLNGSDVESTISRYQSDPTVAYAEPDYVISISPAQTGAVLQGVNPEAISKIPGDPLFSDQWGLWNTGQTGGTPGDDIGAGPAWGISTGSAGIIVAVVDTGILYTHSDLAANIWTNPKEIPGNGIDDDRNGYIDDINGWNFMTGTPDPFDDNGHGSHVSGIIGAVGNNGLGIAGVNWQVRLMNLKVLDSSGTGHVSDAIPAILYANANGASVISNSWTTAGYSRALKDAIDVSPAVVVCAAGNTPREPEPDNDIIPLYPASFTSPNIISVAASDQNDQLASFSHYGPVSVDLTAPGVDIASTLNFPDTYGYMSGTSMATPHVSGVAALVRSVNSSLTNTQVVTTILSTVEPVPSLSGRVGTGGRLDAYRALLAA